MNLKIKDGRKERMKLVYEKNKIKIIDFFQNNPDTTISDCATATGLSITAITTHLKKLGVK